MPCKLDRPAHLSYMLIQSCSTFVGLSEYESAEIFGLRMRGATVQQCQVCGDNRSTNPHGARGGDSGCYQNVTARARTMDERTADVKEVIYTARHTRNTFGTVAQHHILAKDEDSGKQGEGQVAKGFVGGEIETVRHIRPPSAPPASTSHKNTHALHRS